MNTPSETETPDRRAVLAALERDLVTHIAAIERLIPKVPQDPNLLTEEHQLLLDIQSRLMDAADTITYFDVIVANS